MRFVTTLPALFAAGLMSQVHTDGKLVLPRSTRSVSLDSIDLGLSPSVEGDRIVLPGPVVIRLMRGEGGEFLGLGRVTIRGVEVRSGATPLMPTLEGAAPHAYTSCRLVRAKPDPGGGVVVLSTELVARDGSVDELEWTLRSRKLDVLDRTAVGFSYEFASRSRARKVHWLIDHATWSLGGTVDGCLCLAQVQPYGQTPRCFVIDAETRIAPRQPLSLKITPECRASTGPRLDFLGAANASLIRFIREPALTFNQCTREPGEPEATAVERWVAPLGREIRTQPMNVLLHPGGGVQAWLDAHHVVSRLQHAAAGIHPTPPLPMTQQGDIPHTAAFLDRCEASGFRRIWVWCRWQTNWSEWDRLTPEQQKGIRTKQPLSHAVLKLEWGSKFDVAELRAYALEATRRGIELFFWFPTSHLSYISPLLDEHPEWIVRRRDGSRYDYAYPDIQGVFHPAGFGAYALERLDALRRDVPFHGLFFDSFQTYGSDVVNYGDPAWPDQFEEILELVRSLDRRGLKLYAESLTPWLQSSTGIWNEKLAGREFMLTGTAPHMGARTMSPKSYFRLLAFNSLPVIRIGFWDKDEAMQRLGTYVNRAYCKVASDMHRCRLLPDGRGTVWDDHEGRPAALYAFETTRVDLAALGVTDTADAREALDGERAPVEHGSLTVRPYHVYRLAR